MKKSIKDIKSMILFFRMGSKMKRIDKINYYLDMTEVALERSTCIRRNWGAIIVKRCFFDIFFFFSFI